MLYFAAVQVARAFFSARALGGGDPIAFLLPPAVWLMRRLLKQIWLLQEVFFFFFSFWLHNSLVSCASKIVPCIASRQPLISWVKVRPDGLNGLRDLVGNISLIDEDCRQSYFPEKRIWGVSSRSSFSFRLFDHTTFIKSAKQPRYQEVIKDRMNTEW